jgi:hypothetical protein
MGDRHKNPDGTHWSEQENPSGMDKRERKAARRSDRKEAREQKHEDIKDGESRKEAREDKHDMKQADRQKWKDGKYSIAQSMHYQEFDQANAMLG